MKKLLCFLGGALLLSNGYGQNFVNKSPKYVSGKIYINSRLPDITLGHIIRYKDSVAKLSNFYNKIVILDFWFTQCTTCIAEFPKEDSLQKLFAKDIQIIPVAYESKQVITAFLYKWEQKNHRQLSLPIIVEDSALNKYFDNIYFPHYVWILQDRTIAAATSDDFMSKENIQSLIRETKDIKSSIQKDNNYFKNNPSMSMQQINKYYHN